ncbi:MAG: plastocyanin/azurin family copper-binding protein [Patescibacteria group bacterium]
MNSKILIAAVVLLVVLGTGVYLLTKNSTTTAPVPVATPTPTTAAIEETPTAAPSEAMTKTSGTVKEITVTGSSFKFVPATISVKKGDTVKVTFVNSGGSHNFVIDEFSVSTKVIASGQSETVSFVADKVGTYEYYCTVGNHRQKGMVGKLIVQ